MQRAHRRPSRRGSNAVEFALIVPVLLALTAGIVDYGWYYSQQLSVIHAAREGVRAGAMTSRDEEPYPVTVAHDRTWELMGDIGYSCTTLIGDEVPTTGTASGWCAINAWISEDDGEDLLNVRVSARFTPLMGLLGGAYPDAHRTLSTMRLEHQ